MKKCKIFLKQRVKHLVQLKSKLIEKRVENSLKCFARRYEYVWGEFLWKNMILFNMVTDWNVNLLMKKCLLGVKVKQHSFTLTPTFLSVIYIYKCIYIYIYIYIYILLYNIIYIYSSISVLNWSGALKLSLLLKLTPGELEPSFPIWSFFLFRLLCIYKSTIHSTMESCSPVWAGGHSCYLQF